MEIECSSVQFLSAGHPVPAHLCRPMALAGHAAVIVIHEIFGLNDHIKDVASRFAKEGYVALAPDLFSREGSPAGLGNLEAMFAFWREIPDSQMVGDLIAGVQFLRDLPYVRGDQIGAVGFCMGGVYSFHLACRSRDLRAAVVFYGGVIYREKSEKKPASPIDLVDRLSCPLLGLYGGADVAIPVEHVNRLEERLKESGKTFELKIYPGAPHAFFADTRESYRPDAAGDAWDKTLAFFERYLKRWG